MNTFSELLPSLKATLDERGWSTPTEIQARAIPALMLGHSVVGVSETGSGKTLAYVLPLLHKLKELENAGDAVKVPGRPRAAVLVPTRELGEQVAKVFKIFTHATRLRVRTVLGGMPMAVAKRNVAGAFEVVVATPGRLGQLLERESLSLEDVRWLVFDEADQMLDSGFLNEANYVVAACPPERQLALFTATASGAVQELIRTLFEGAEVIRTAGSHLLVPTLTTVNRPVTDGDRAVELEDLLQDEVAGGTMIFANTRAQCEKIADTLDVWKVPCVVYRGEMDPVERRANLKAFREGKVAVLVSTDLASRGLDLEHVGRVINYHLPQDLDNYIHRVGRTARAGRPGLVVNLVTDRDRHLMQQVKNLAEKSQRRPR